MSTPTFEFTDRAAPIVQFGRPERPTGDDRWQQAHWGEGFWGKADWEPLIWTDLTCEIHQISTNTGRGSASDRFVPGTAHIVASNVHDVADMIFPRVPGPAYESELVPQPPITNEEELQAPNAATVTSNGWSFTDDFQTRPPRWIFPPAFATTGTFPTTPFIVGDGYLEPEMYLDGTGHWQAHSVAQWTGVFPYPQLIDCELHIDDLDWPVAASGGSPQLVVEMYAFGNTTDRACNCARITLTPVFAGNNTATVDLFRMGSDGSRVDGISAAVNVTSGLGTNGHFGELRFRASFDPFNNGAFAGVNDLGTPVLEFTEWVTGSRIGFALHYVEGTVTGIQQGAPHVTFYSGPAFADVPAFTDDFSRPTGSGWVGDQYGSLIMEAGALSPPWEFNGEGYAGVGSAQWVSEFDGDQFLELDLGSISRAPIGYGDGPYLEISLKGNRRDSRSVVAIIDYLVRFDTDDCRINWQLVQYGPNEEWEYDPDLEDVSYGQINLGETDGQFPEPATWRLEADTAGEVRLYYQRALLTTVEFPDIPQGGRVGVHLFSEINSPTVGVRRVGVARIEHVSAGLREPLGTEDLGIWIRIGVDHATLGNQWFLRGCVDGIVPTYVPERPDAVRIECIDTLGEAGRVRILGDQLPHEFAPATTRIHQILNRAHWPRNLMIIREDETVMSRPASGKAVDALTHVAESCGGAIWSDPRNGNIVFKGQDWQGEVAGGPAIAVITNTDPEDPAIDAPRVCPTGWERSSRREDMNTRVRYSTVASQGEDREPLIREWRAPNAESIYGVELYERTLLCTTGDRLNELGRRQLRLRHPNQFPRVEAVLLDAATADEALDLMTMANWMIPSKYRCQLRRAGTYVFNRSYLVTGIQHTMSPERWTCRLALDIASAFAETGARWDEARWGTPGDTWGRSR